jgi:putative phosphoribosyl transferase
MNQPFPNRSAAGRLLAEKLASLTGQPGLLVLALPRGGVPVAAEVAHLLKAPLDVLVVRKLGAPASPEFALGAIASGGLRVLNARALETSRVKPAEVDALAARETLELNRREKAYRRGRPALELRGHPVILVDDGIATGSSMRVAVAAAREARAGRIVVAAPVATRESYLELRETVDEFVTLNMPRNFSSVGEFYADFGQTTDAEVQSLLSHAWRETAH